MANKNFVVHNGLTAGNITIDAASGNVTATKFIGDGSSLTGLPASYTNSNVSAYLPTHTGNIGGGNLTLTGTITTTGGNITTNGNIVAAKFYGDGSNLTNVPAGSLAGTAASINVSGNATVGNLTVSNKVMGDLIPSANITYTLGDRTHQWKDLFVGPGSIYVNGQKVLEQLSDTIVFGADPNQNIAIRTLGTGDVEINTANTGVIAFKGPVQFDDAYNFTTTSGGAVPFTTGMKVPSITAYGTNATLTLAGTGTGSISLNDDVTVTGNLTVNGTTTALNVNNLNVQDNIVNISNGTTGTPTLNAGLQVMRGDEPNVQFRWNESIDKWQFTNDGLNYNNVLASTEITSIGTLSALSVTGNVSAGGFSGAHYGSGAGLTSIPNSALNNSSITVNNTLISLGGSATVTANAQTLTSDTLASGVTKSSLTQVGTITTGVWNGSAIQNSYLASSSLSINGTAVSLGGSATVTANAQTLTGTVLNSTVVASSLTSVGNLTVLNASGNISTTGNVVAAKFYGSGAGLTAIPNSALTNSSITVNGAAVSLGGSVTIDTSAGGLTGNTLNSSIVNSSLTSVGDLTALTVTGAATVGSLAAGNISIGVTADAITSTGTLTLDPSPAGSGGLVVIQGNLQVTGTTTTVNSTTVEVADLNITLAKDATTAAAANGAGLTVAGANATFNYASTGDKWTTNKPLDITGNVTATAFSGSGAYLTAIPNSALTNSSITINGSAISLGGSVTINTSASGLTGNTLNSTIVNSSLTSVGTIATGVWQGSVIQPAYIATLNQNTTGSAASLTTARNINGVAFNGTADITITAAAGTLTGTTLNSTVVNSSLTSVGTITTGVWNGSAIQPSYIATLNQNTTGSAASLTTARNINGVAFNGTADITVTANAATLTGTVLNSTVVASSLTSVGNLTSLSASGTISTTGNVVAAKFYGDGSSLTGVVATSVGTLSSLTVTGNISAGNVSATNLTGTLTTAAQTNITSVGTLGSLSVTGNVTAGGFSGPVYGSGAGLTSIPNAALTNSSVTVNGTTISLGASGTVTANAATLTGTVLNSTVVASSLTSVGTLSALTVSGAITVNSGNNVTAIINGGTSGTGNIGASGATFNTIFAKATTAQYADLAEKYAADAEYEPGTVLCFGGSAEVTVCDHDADRKVAGVVTTNPAYMMNDAIEAEHSAAIALQGRVPCKVVGPVALGDMLVSAGAGRARAEADPKVGSVIGKALATHAAGEGVIEVAVGRF